MKQIIVHKGRTNKVTVRLPYDVSADVITSEIREEQNPTSNLIAAWDVSYVTDGVDGVLELTLDNAVTANITKSKGYMDLKRVSGAEPMPVFDDLLEVLFKDVVTA